GRDRAARVLPADGPGRPALHRRGPATLRRTRPAGARGVGPRGHVDPRRQGPPARPDDPGRRARDRRRRGPPHPARPARAPGHPAAPLVGGYFGGVSATISAVTWPAGVR